MACLLKVLGLYLLLQRRKTRQPHPTVDPALRSTGANQIPWTTGTAGLIRSMMADWDRRYPGRTESVFSALQNIVPSHLADNVFFDFKGLRLGTELNEVDGGDTVFDAPFLFGEELTVNGNIILNEIGA